MNLLKLRFYRQERCVYLVDDDWWIYGEWLYDDDFIIPDNLFEI